MEIGNIVQGHINELLGLNKNISETRLKICYACPIYSPQFGGVCNSRLWLNKITGDVSTEPKEGYQRGCGCRLKAKTKVTSESCPLDKW